MDLSSFVFLNIIVLVLSKPVDFNNIKREEIIDGFTVQDKLEIVNETEISKNNIVQVKNQIRPGMLISGYDIEIDADVDEEEFHGKVVIRVSITDASTREDPVMLYVEDLEVTSVVFTILSGSNVHEAEYNVDDGILEIDPGIPASSYTFTIEYSGSLAVGGKGLHLGQYGDK
ncbi:hypothetical protein PYW08_001421 [Mythimna loreyi]|uniref:Uncharacterized protein n=1 Tax=Mythimna loreyi TaxID=667449 RepID=A0ACC2R4H5_9NEOP|nr:hypothetical protein PYW08_001421 [Mythimna loreyi]